jgi:hypothetical protein
MQVSRMSESSQGAGRELTYWLTVTRPKQPVTTLVRWRRTCPSLAVLIDGAGVHAPKNEIGNSAAMNARGYSKLTANGPSYSGSRSG